MIKEQQEEYEKDKLHTVQLERDNTILNRKLLHAEEAGAKLEARLKASSLSKSQQEKIRQKLDLEERNHLREKRLKMSPDDFTSLKLIGRGAFGEVGCVLS